MICRSEEGLKTFTFLFGGTPTKGHLTTLMTAASSYCVMQSKGHVRTFLTDRAKTLWSQCPCSVPPGGLLTLPTASRSEVKMMLSSVNGGVPVSDWTITKERKKNRI